MADLLWMRDKETFSVKRNLPDFLVVTGPRAGLLRSHVGT